MASMMYYMYFLLENYGTDPEVTYLLNNREIFFVPVVNPDGYVFNQTTNPNGGGGWRKNRKNNGGSFGVDLNRNYGIYQYWNASNGGSSTSPSSDTYRGTSPFSELETQAAMNFVNSRNISAILGAHTYGNYLIKPWAWQDPTPTPDDYKFNEYLADMTKYNHYTTGTPSQTVGYTVRGSADDWYYNDSGHSKAFAMTPEVGTSSDGFWPLQSRILILAGSTLSQNIYFSMACGPYTAPVKSSLDKEQYTAGESGNLRVNFKNKGLMNAQNVKIELTSLNPLLNIGTGTFSYPAISSFAEDSLNFSFNITAAAPLNSAIKATLTIKQDNVNTVYIQDIYIPVGGGSVLFLDSAENGISRWTASGGWGLTTTQYYSPNNSFADSPTGNYSNTTTRSLTLTTALNVSASPVLKLSFWYKHTIDTLDNAYVDISSDNGATWKSAKYYNKTMSSWNREVLDISSLANSTANLKIRFSMVSNGSVVADGIYIDNIKLTGYNNTPTSIAGTTEIPESYSLSQNYPNPFNPSTVISYNLAEGNFISLKVYNELGKEVATLVSERQNPGSYSINFNGSNLSSGLYYYKLQSGDFSDTKKMLLVK